MGRTGQRDVGAGLGTSVHAGFGGCVAPGAGSCVAPSLDAVGTGTGETDVIGPDRVGAGRGVDGHGTDAPGKQAGTGTALDGAAETVHGADRFGPGAAVDGAGETVQGADGLGAGAGAAPPSANALAAAAVPRTAAPAAAAAMIRTRLAGFERIERLQRGSGPRGWGPSPGQTSETAAGCRSWCDAGHTRTTA
jgi:hypothetical protein